jgi:SAM-dependent methyltransferase
LSWHVEDSRWKARQIRQILTKNHIQPQTVAEVGCGAGAILSHLSDAMPDTWFVGYEVSPQAFAICQQRASDRVRFEMRDVADVENHVDCLLCVDVFEHVEDYIGFVRALRPKARYTVFHVPLDVTVLSVLRDKMMDARRRVGHLHYFTPATALATIEYCGFRVLDHCFTPAFRDLPGQSIRSRLARLPRRLLYALSPRVMAKLLGGCSLLVLAE